MGKKYISKRLNKSKVRLQRYKSADPMELNQKTVTEGLATPVKRPETPMTKKLRTAHAELRSRSVSRANSVFEDDEKSRSDEISLNDVNIIINIGVILGLVNQFKCSSCRRVGKISQSHSASRSSISYHIFL